MKHNGNIGIGTDSPAIIPGMSKYLTLSSKTVDHAVAFELQGNRTGSNQTVGRISFINNANEIAKINVDSSGGGTNGNLTFTTSGTEKLRITSDGSVGIGTNNPSAKLDIQGSDAELRFYRDARDRFGGLRYTGSKFTLRLPASDHFVIDDSSNNEIFRVTAAGDVGIGTDNPARRVEIFDTAATVLQLNSTNSGGTSLRIQNSGTDKMYMGLAGDFITGQGSNVTDSAIRASGALLFASGGGTERLRIKSDGKVGIGTDNPEYQTTIAADGANAKLNIKRKTAAASNGNAFGSLFYTNSDGTDVASIRAHRESANDDAYLGFATKETGESISEKLRITSDGYARLTTANARLEWTASSGSNPFIRSIGSGQQELEFNTGGDERFRITSTGALNIGKGDEASNAANLVEMYVGATDETYATIRGKYNRTNEFNRSEIRFGVQDNANGRGFLAFATGNNSATEKLRITHDGNVGIGSDDPQNKLDVAGDVKILDNSPRLFFYDANASGASNATGGFEVFDKDGNKNVFVGAFAPNADNLIFGVTGSERGKNNF